MGTSLRELLHKFKSKTLVLLKLLLLEKRVREQWDNSKLRTDIRKKILFYGYPVERLCTFEYSLMSLVPGMLVRLSLEINLLTME